MSKNQIATRAVTMSSLEMVDYINSQRKEDEAVLRHADFLEKVPLVLGEEMSGKFRSSYKDSMNRSKPCYHFPKREACLMAMSYSYELQAQVFDKMTALEEHVKLGAGRTALPPPAKLFPDYFKVARLIGCDKNAAAISANNAVFQKTGENVLQLLGHVHMEAEKQELFFNVSDLMDGVSGQRMNKLLASAGLQEHDGKHWIPTKDGMDFCRIYDTGKSHSTGAPVQQVKWSREVLDLLTLGVAA
jgi:hypothetical protein